MVRMSSEALGAFLRETRIAKLASLEQDGRPTIIPIWFEWDGTTARMFSGRDTAKVRRIEADPRVALTVETGVGENEAWATLEGNARIVETDALPLVRRLAERYYEAVKAAETLRGWEPNAASWVVIELTPERVRSLAPS